MTITRGAQAGSPGPLRRRLLSGIALLGLAVLPGCQAEYAGVTLPSPHYMYDDVQYFAPGPDFVLQNELSAMQEAGGGGIAPPSATAEPIPQPRVGPLHEPQLPPGAIPGPGTIQGPGR